MGLPHIWTPDMIDVVRAGWAAGDKIEDIGIKVGLHYGAVARKARQMKLGPHPRGSKRLAPNVAETVRQMAAGGKSRSEIVAATGVCRETARLARKELTPRYVEVPAVIALPPPPSAEVRKCQYILNDKRPWLFCHAPSSGSWCWARPCNRRPRRCSGRP